MFKAISILVLLATPIYAGSKIVERGADETKVKITEEVVKEVDLSLLKYKSQSLSKRIDALTAEKDELDRQIREAIDLGVKESKGGQ